MIRSLKIAHKTVILLTELIAGLFFLSLAALLILLWNFSRGPVDVTFAADYVQKALLQGHKGPTLSFDGLVAEWPRFDGPLSLGLHGFKILKDGKTVLDIQSVGLRIAKAPLLIGLFKPEAILLNQPRLQVIREETGAFRFLVGGDGLEGLESSPSQGALPHALARDIAPVFFLDNAKTPESSFSVFSRLEQFEVKDALLVTEDHISKATWVVPKVNAVLHRKRNAFDLALEYQMAGVRQKSRITLEVRRETGKQGLHFEGKVDHLDLALFSNNFLTLRALDGQKFILNSDVSGDLSPEMSLTRFRSFMTSEQGSLNLSTTFEHPLTFRDLKANIAYDREEGKLVVSDTSVLVNEIRLELSAERNLKTESGPFVPVRLRVPKLSFSEIAALWPKSYADTLLAEWLTQKLSDGSITDLDIFLKIDPKNPLSLSTEQVKASFDFENLTADYRSPLIPARAARGHATIEDDALKIQVAAGKLADMEVHSASVLVTNLTRPDPGVVHIDVDLTGPLKTAFDYIARDPIHLSDFMAKDKSSIEGRANLQVHIDFPAIRDLSLEAVKVAVEGRLNDIHLPKIVRGLDLGGGPYALTVVDKSFTLSGKGVLGNRPIDLVYSEYLDPAKAPFVSDITAKISADQGLRESFGLSLDPFVEGVLPVEIHYKELKKNTATIEVKADLTPVRFRVRPFGYDKAEGVQGEASCTALVEDEALREIRDLKASVGQSLSLTGALTFAKRQPGTTEQDIKRGTFRILKLGEDNDFTLTFEQSAPQTFTLDLSGKSLDARSFLSAREDAPPVSNRPSPAVKLNARVERMRTGKQQNQFIQHADIFAEIDANGEMRALDLRAVAGKGALLATIKPDPQKRMQLDLSAENAGEALYAFDVYDNVIGGTLKVRGEQIPGAGVNDLKGHALITDFSVVKAPALAKLVNAFSISGLAELLQNKGIAFSKLKVDFIWKKKPEGRIVSLINGRTSGASIGLSFGGLINQTKGTTDISGTVVPMSGINGIVNKIPLVGTLLTGGRNGGIIAATYAIKGPSDTPTVLINPLSVLAPGFLRSILFEGGIDLGPDERLDEPEKPQKKSFSAPNE